MRICCHGPRNCKAQSKFCSVITNFQHFERKAPIWEIPGAPCQPNFCAAAARLLSDEGDGSPHPVLGASDPPAAGWAPAQSDQGAPSPAPAPLNCAQEQPQISF